jgi:hypothetical protein
MDLNSVNIKDILCTSEAIKWLTSLGREEMPDAVGISDFNYNPKADHYEAAPKGGKANEASTKDAEATLAAQDPLVDP